MKIKELQILLVDWETFISLEIKKSLNEYKNKILDMFNLNNCIYVI